MDELSPFAQTLITVLLSVFTCSGFWAYMNKRREKNDARTLMLKGLGHDRIMELGNRYINRGNITSEEYENFRTYLYEPYAALGGNGSGKHMMEKVDKLKIVN